MSNNISFDKSAADALMNQLMITAETYSWSESIRFEFILWEQLAAEDTRLPVETIEQIKEKSAAAGGWWVWPNGIHREALFVSSHEWGRNEGKSKSALDREYRCALRENMPNHREQFIVNAPKEAVDDAIEEHFNHVLWNVLSKEPGRVLVEEKLLFGKEPYNPVTFVGPTQIEILLRSIDTSTEVICKGSSEYFGDDSPLHGKRDLRNGHYRAQAFLAHKISACRLAIERKAKSWSAKQRYRAIKEQQVAPQLQPNTSTPKPIVITVAAGRALGGLKPEQLSIEDFIAQLERLATLQKSGALTDAEFEQAKTRLLKATE